MSELGDRWMKDHAGDDAAQPAVEMRRGNATNQVVGYVLAIVVAGGGGFFLGQEHQKEVLRDGIRDAFSTTFNPTTTGSSDAQMRQARVDLCVSMVDLQAAGGNMSPADEAAAQSNCDTTP